MVDLVRCLGNKSGPTGHMPRMDCDKCLRRLAPRAGELPWMEPQPEYPCLKRIPYDKRIPMLHQMRKAAP